MITPPPFITVVSGLPRSGTSLVMQMLAAGGMPILADGVRQVDVDNPAGYFEFEPVMRTRSDSSWVPLAAGKAVKVVYLFLPHLPTDYSYRVIFVRRDLNEVIASQQLMLQRRGERGAPLDAAEMASVFQRQLEKTLTWLAGQPSFSVSFIDYRDVVAHPRPQAERIRDFLDLDLQVDAMSKAVKPELYRQRSS